jgi:Mce-associated membrane protein
LDVVAIRPDELTGEGDEPASDEAAGSPRRPGRTLLLAAPFVVLAVLIATVVVLLLRAQDHNKRDDARNAAVQVARQEAVNLTTLSYQTAARDLDRILALATGQLRQRFAAERGKFPTVLGQQHSQSTGTILSAGLVRLSSGLDAAEVAVAADASVTVASGPGRSAPTVKHYRMVMQLQLVNGHWLVSDVAFAGVPQ